MGTHQGGNKCNSRVSKKSIPDRETAQGMEVVQFAGIQRYILATILHTCVIPDCGRLSFFLSQSALVSHMRPRPPANKKVGVKHHFMKSCSCIVPPKVQCMGL